MIYDLLIVGASLAGASLANLMTQKGYSVVIIDKATFPRSKACGEGLSSTGHEIIKKIGITLPSSAPHLAGYNVNYNAQKLEINYPFGVGIQRLVLDNLLIKHLQQENKAQLLLGKNVQALNKTANGWQLEYDNGQVEAKQMVLACGAYSPIYQQLQIKEATPKYQRLGASCTFRGQFPKPLQKVEIFLKEQYQLLVTPVDENTYNLSFFSSRAKKIYKADQILNLMRDCLKQLNFSGENITRPIGKSILAGIKRKPYQGNSVSLLGDACEQLDPIGGMGMTHALLSAELLANNLDLMFQNKLSEKKALQKYAKEHAKMIRPYRGFTKTTYSMLIPLRGLTLFNKTFSRFIGTKMASAIHSSQKTWLDWTLNKFLTLCGN